jgi:hypothetical protein
MILSCEPHFDYIPLKQLKPKASNTRGKNSVHGNSTSLLSLAGTTIFTFFLTSNKASVEEIRKVKNAISQ